MNENLTVWQQLDKAIADEMDKAIIDEMVKAIVGDQPIDCSESFQTLLRNRYAVSDQTKRTI